MLRHRLGLDDNLGTTATQAAMAWAYDVKRQCMEHEVEGARPRGRPKNLERDLWKKTVRHVN